MAERNFDVLEVLGRKKRVIAGSFAPNGNSALVAADTRVSGGGATVAYVSTGLYRITFTDKYASLLAALASLQLAAADDKHIQVGTYTAADKTLDIRVYDSSGAGAADVAANANNRINFLCVFDDAVVL